MRSLIKIILAGTCVLTSVANAGPDTEFSIVDVQVVDLGTMGGDDSVANDINDYGEIVGWSNLRDATQRGFLWSNGVFEAVTPVGYVGEARGINNLTQIVGHVYHGVTPHAFYSDARTRWWLLPTTDATDC